MSRIKELFARSLVLVPIFAVVASPSLPAIDASYAAELGATLPDLQREIAEMSTGEDQQLMLAGTDAQSRNALIPMIGGSHAGLSAYSPFAAGSDSYSTALTCMTQAIYYEAANEPETGKRAVAQVVMNRMRHPAYPNSVCGVVYQGVNARVCQFSFTCDGALLRKPLQRQWSQSLAVAKDALAGRQLPEVGTATHYHADYVVPKWAFTLEKLKVIGTHIFYRFPGRAGRSAAFQARWSQSERIPQINWARFDADEEMVEELAVIEEDAFVPGLTVTADPKDRHAPTDVGGRIDTTKEWRLSIPDPVGQKGSYAATVSRQGDLAAPGTGSATESGS
ncbi:cell wall hydrolase [Erythrobacter sp. JK5]|uniref:cell wall hydrolase n=1 Tax=Erythrobacter sp. JK5 TaxID=2829500 RepID=UPI001BA5A436|nr:cell wall hydrolase [Erythrobacter sp. JK5]QUL37993.1 cell wall hydrolase [Erythrobacter sp. JK5]